LFPWGFSCKLSKFGVDIFLDPTLYFLVVGALLYATLTRAKISFAVDKVCQFMAKPLESQQVDVKQIPR